MDKQGRRDGLCMKLIRKPALLIAGSLFFGASTGLVVGDRCSIRSIYKMKNELETIERIEKEIDQKEISIESLDDKIDIGLGNMKKMRKTVRRIQHINGGYLDRLDKWSNAQFMRP